MMLMKYLYTVRVSPSVEVDQHLVAVRFHIGYIYTHKCDILSVGSIYSEKIQLFNNNHFERY